jgi:two-component system response regulator AtoC
MDRLVRYGYPGNIRELENIIKRTILLNDPGMLKTLPLLFDSDRPRRSPGPCGSSSRPLKEIARSAARAAERQAIAKALAETSWNRRRAATLLKINYRAMLNKIRNLELERRAGSLTAGGDRPDAEPARGVGRWQ